MFKTSTLTLQTKDAIGDIEIWGGWASGNAKIKVFKRFVLKEAWDFGDERLRPLPMLHAARTGHELSSIEPHAERGLSLRSAAAGSASAAGMLLAAALGLGALRRGRLAMRRGRGGTHEIPPKSI